MVNTLHLISSLVTIIAISESVSARPTVFVPNSKFANKIAASPSNSTSSDSASPFFVSTGPNLYIPGRRSSSPNSQNTEPVSAAASPLSTLGRPTPSVTLTAPTNLPYPSYLPSPTPLPLPSSESWSARLLKRLFSINIASLQSELYASRAESGERPTPWTPAQINRHSILSARASKSSSKSAAAAATRTTKGSSPDSVKTTTSRTTTTKKPSSSSTTTTKKSTTTTSKSKTTTSKSKTTTTSKPRTTTTTTTSKRTTTTTTTTSKVPEPTSPSGGGLSDGQTFWKQKNSFYSLESFQTDVVDGKRYSWGGDNIAVVQGVPAKEWTGGKQGDKLSALQVAYPKGSRNPGAQPQGGVGFYSSKSTFTPFFDLLSKTLD